MSEERVVIGIDLGTTYTAMAYCDEVGAKIIENDEGQRTTPTVVFFEDSGNVMVGREAKNSLVIEPMNGVELAKREIANLSSAREKRVWEIYDKKYTPEDISSLILKKLKKDASQRLGTEVVDAVITVPAYFDLAAREATRNSGILAGFNVLALLNEPEAAAIAFTHGKARKPETIFVYDLGGGTFDVSILKFDGERCEVLATDGDHQLGGADFDRQILDYITNAASENGTDVKCEIEELQRLKDSVEITKMALSSAQKKRIIVDKKTYELTREKYQELIEEKLSETEATMNKALEAAKEKGVNGWEDIDRVLLVGGSSKIPAVRSLVARITGKEPDVSLNPDEAISLGAAIYGSIYKEIERRVEKEQEEENFTPEEAEEKKILYLDGKVSSVCSHSIGIMAITEKGVRKNAMIIRKNTKIPCEGEHLFGTKDAHQETACIRIMLGESEDPEECREAGKVTLRLKGDLPKESPIRVKLQYDLEGRLKVYSEAIKDGSKIETTLDLKEQLSAEEIASQKEELDKIEVQ